MKDLTDFFEFATPEKTVDRRQRQTLWAERYRPVTLDEFVGNETVKNAFADFIASGDPPHLLLQGKQGTGKTTLALMLVDTLDCDFIKIDASTENSVDTVRSKIIDFASGMSLRGLKIVVLDEADHLSRQAQASLRSTMETFSETTRFILTCNYHEKILDPIKSRVQTFSISPPNREDVAMQLVHVLNDNNVTWKPETVGVLVDKYYPDIRKILNEAQKSSKTGALLIDAAALIEGDFKLKLLSILSDKGKKPAKFTAIRQLLADNKVNDFTEVYGYLYAKLDDFTDNAPGAITAIAEAQYRESMVADREINAMAMFVRLIEVSR